MRAQSLRCPTLCDPLDCSPPGSSVHEIFRQEHWSGLSFPPPGDLPNPGIKPVSPMSPALQAESLPPEPWGKPSFNRKLILKFLTYKLSHVKWIASPGLMHDTGCLGLVHWDNPEGWYREGGGGFRMGNTCIPVADSCWCMAKPIQYCKVINFQLK